MTLKELKILWLDREALALLFAMPLFFILVMSFALEGVFQAGSKGYPIEILVVHKNGGSLAEQVITDLKRIEGLLLIETHEGLSLTSEKAERLIEQRVFPLALLFPENYTEKVLGGANRSKGERVNVYLMSDPAMNAQLLATVKGTIQGTIERWITLGRISQHLRVTLGTLMGMEEQWENLIGDAKGFRVEGSPVEFIHIFPKGYHLGRRPTATEQNVPAYTIFGVFFIVLTLASSFLQEKKDGTFQRILAAPLSRAALLIGKLLPYYLVNLIQIGLMFCMGVIVFGIHLGHLPSLALVSLSLAAAANGLGLLIAALAKTEPQVNGLSVLLAITLSALGGMMVPSFIMPDWMRTLSLFTPHAWALTGYHDVMIRGLGVKDILTEMVVLLGFATSFFFVALWRFRFH